MMEAETGVVHLPGRRSEEGHSHQGRDEEGAAQHLRGSVVLPTPRLREKESVVSVPVHSSWLQWPTDSGGAQLPR